MAKKMSKKDKICKYIRALKECEKIEVFVDPDLGAKKRARWIHFIDNDQKFIGFTIAFPRSPIDDFVNEEIDFMVRHAQPYATDPSDAARLCAVKTYKRDGVLVRKNGEWAWIK